MLINSIFIWWIISSDLPVSEHLRLLRNSLPNHGVPDNRDVGPVSRTPGWTVDSSHIISVEGREGRSVRERERERDKELWNGDRERQSLEEKERERHDGETNRNETKTVNSVLGSHWKRFYKKFRTISVFGGLQKYRDEYIFGVNPQFHTRWVFIWTLWTLRPHVHWQTDHRNFVGGSLWYVDSEVNLWESVFFQQISRPP